MDLNKIKMSKQGIRVEMSNHNTVKGCPEFTKSRKRKTGTGGWIVRETDPVGSRERENGRAGTGRTIEHRQAGSSQSSFLRSESDLTLIISDSFSLRTQISPDLIQTYLNSRWAATALVRCNKLWIADGKNDLTQILPGSSSARTCLTV